MKQSTKNILNSFPVLEDKIPNDESVLLEEQVLNQLNDTEQVFLKLVWFFEKPYENNFNLFDLFNQIDKDWLSLALESITIFFYKDNYFEDNTSFLILTEQDEYLNQSDFADFLNENKEAHGKKFSRPMVNTYLKRGLIPSPDIEIAGAKYWLKETCAEYVQNTFKN